MAPEDVDSDGFKSPADCDDTDPAVHPDAQEVCDGIDNDCDGAVDDLDVVRYRDLDGDGHGNPDISVSACTAPLDYVASGDDCNDSDPRVSPSAEEVCDGIDNDCDGETDSPAVNTDFYRDDDGDGYGVGDPLSACEAPDGHVLLDGDCDDEEVRVSPGHPEVCDGIDNDCEPTTLEEGTVAWINGTLSTDLTALFAAGTDAAPGSIALSEDGTVYLCGGTWYVSVDIRADIDVVGLGASPEDNTLSGGGIAPVLSWPLERVLSSISNITLTDGAGRYDNGYSQTVGGGARCQSQSTITLQDVEITDSTASLGAGVFIDGCAVTITDATITNNHAESVGGGIANTTGDTVVERTLISGNSAPTGGGVSMMGHSRSELTLIDTLITDNTAVLGGGLVLSSWASASCSDTGTGSAGFTANISTLHGGGILLQLYDQYSGTLTVDDCDLGASGTGADNSPEDVYLDTLGVGYSAYGDGAVFSCDYTGCQ